jgi:hypothetical protein
MALSYEFMCKVVEANPSSGRCPSDLDIKLLDVLNNTKNIKEVKIANWNDFKNLPKDNSDLIKRMQETTAEDLLKDYYERMKEDK